MTQTYFVQYACGFKDPWVVYQQLDGKDRSLFGTYPTQTQADAIAKELNGATAPEKV